MITGTAKIIHMDENKVTFRYSIDEAFPEVVLITITRERWEREMYEDTSAYIRVEFPHEQAKDVRVLT